MTDLGSVISASCQNVGNLDNPQYLRRSAEMIMNVAQLRGATHLVAASPFAERLIGAVMLMPGSAVHACPYESTAEQWDGESVLVVDVNLASGASLAGAARRARTSGAGHVSGAVLHVLSTAVGAVECGLDALDVLG